MATYQRRLINEKGEFDHTAEQMAIVLNGAGAAEKLGAALQKGASEILYAMCLPVFRDALAFYDEQGKLLCTLNICFECLYMETGEKVIVEAGIATYQALRELLVQLGHPIAEIGW